MNRRAAVPGPNPLVILVVVVGLIMVALVSIAARGGASTTAAPTPTTPNGLHGHLHAAAHAPQIWDRTVAILGHELGSPKP